MGEKEKQATDLDSPTERHRPATESRKVLARRMAQARRAGALDQEDAELIAELDGSRPRTRADCVSGTRPCVFVRCQYNLYLDVNPKNGSIKLNFPNKELWELEHTCALDVAEQGGVILEQVGDLMNLTRERIRQLEQTGLGKLRAAIDSD